jgi:hypothetical protein
MPRHIPVLVASAFAAVTVTAPADLFAQGLAPALSVPQVSTQASMRNGRIKGIVRDDAGQAVRGVSIVAMGSVLASARSDERGSFTLALPPGEYVLRAVCEGYVSTYREPVRVHSSALLEREITLTRQGVAPARAVMLASAGSAAKSSATAPAAEEPATQHAHTEAAWRLRHLPRSILRDGAPVDPAAGARANADSFAPRASFFDRAVGGSARFFTGTDFDGQVNFLTTGAFNGGTGSMPAEWPRGIAYLSVGAPVGRHGDWRMRGAITAGDASSWVLLGEYQAREDAAHAFRAGVSYSAQGYDPQTSGRWSAATTEARNVAGIYGFDQWRVGSALVLDYGLRLDRYDYVASPNLVSPEVGARVAVTGGTHVSVLASRRMIAPGADEFLPPMSSGPWVPPERTFSSLAAHGELRAEEVRHYEFGFSQNLDRRGRRTILLRRFHQSSANQIATIFGLDAASDVGHYYVATPGSLDLDGWGVRLTTQVARRIEASVDYTAATAGWTRRRSLWLLRRAAASVVRPDAERLHDLTAVVKADLPETHTRVTLVYRLNSEFSQPDPARFAAPDGRFDLEIRQALPYRPPGGGRLDVVVAVRSLMRDPRERGSFYDELLTVAPPMRLMGGVQMKF